MEVLLFDREDDARPARVVRLDPVTNRTYHYWHVFVPGVRPGQIYGYRVHGPFDPANGMRYDPGKVLLDPYGRAVVVPRGYDRSAAAAKGDDPATAMKSHPFRMAKVPRIGLCPTTALSSISDRAIQRPPATT